jgi:hypothetical protein
MSLGVPRPNKRVVRGQPRERYYSLQGGEDQISPPNKVSPGSLIFSLNYECDEGSRYKRFQGYEAYDGHNKPSDASYWILSFDASDAAFTAEATVTGQSSSATGILLTQVVESGSYGGSDAAGYLVLTEVSGTFEDDENLQESAVTKAVANGTANERYGSTSTLDDTYIQAAIEYARDQIAAVPGSGEILGLWQYKGVKYAFRNNSGGTAAVMHKSSTSGWTECDLGNTIAFTSGGTTEVSEDDVLVGATSGASATVKRIIVTSGSWAGGDAAGIFILYSQSGTFEAENLNISGGASNVATIASDSTAVTLVASGRYNCINHNFYGASDYYRMYGVDGANKGFEWDGSTFVQITTGMAVDKPTNLAAFKKHLFFAFPGGSLQYSSPGTPYEWDPVTGAAELGIGDDITALMVVAGGTLAILSRNSTNFLNGTSVDDWTLSALSEESGAIEWTAQMLGNNGIYLDDRGVTSLAAVQEYGDFKANTIATQMKPFIDRKKENAKCSLRVRSKNQYRLFFDDKYGVTITFSGNKVIGVTRSLYEDQPVCSVSTEDANGNEELFFGSDDGFVYQLDSGTSMNGSAVTAIARTHYNHLNSPSNKKRFRRMIPEIDGPVDASIYVFAAFSYGEAENTQQLISEYSGEDVMDYLVDMYNGNLSILQTYSGGGILGMSELGAFRLGGSAVGSGTVPINGSGTNIAFAFVSEAIYAEPHTLQGITIHYDIRALRR